VETDDLAQASALLDQGDANGLDALVHRVDQTGALPSLFGELIGAGRYDRLRDLLGDAKAHGDALRALARARPDYGMTALNAAALAAIAKTDFAGYPWQLLIVPGYTPPDAKRPMHVDEVAAARSRLDLARKDLLDERRAPFALVVGGSVHPPGTPLNEALMMREYLIAKGVDAGRILIDPWSRHSTTNVRNAGRLMLAHNLGVGLIVTGFETPLFDQSFYFGHPTLSTFTLRCKADLGYEVGDLDAADDHHVVYRPNPSVVTPLLTDPLDA